MSTGKRDAAKFEVAQRRARALELRLTGMTYRDIADAMGCADSTAHELVTSALREIPAKDVELLRTEQGATIRLLLSKLWPRIERGEPRAIEVAARLLERQAKLYALDVVPPKPPMLITEELVDELIADAERKLRELEEGTWRNKR
ncbi:helix-turn-helix domain-containing protein [Ferrimicrobium sp.]|uniref:helix-turn-helix domain-containing protein n=1 Tax=Ferrimicrobium sp. TaxID=2926050 RepID=UPI00260E342F|nr:helix-turn-helix domain-containing protein [Ferrimicrobium sp.]